MGENVEELVLRYVLNSVSMKDGKNVDPREMLSLICRALSVETCNLAVSNNLRKSLRKAGNHLLSLRDRVSS